ncbi:SH3 domain-containing protein [Paracoccus sp. Z330]|uniref:SH3 domain-containing protein n=1 Tax=Paracoccus onchidii TaxID=3017813 RepID=A0ABT4ZK02_9RHOB|nr:SH3 domain-containing protein [Paracoccus onchidii]MDB6179690.1 SH3 domain-containing protein [Paracoccus onchidii]
MHVFRGVIVAAVISLSTTSAFAQGMRSVDVRFAPGSAGTSISDSIVGYESVLYRVGAEAGQTMRVVLAPSNTATYFNVYAPGREPGDEALGNGQFTDPFNDWMGQLPASGEYTVSVYMIRSAARRDERSDYTVDISVDGATGGRMEADFADGLQGGPDYWAVAVSSSGSLNMRAAPSAGAAIVTQLSSGQDVRNFGCRMAEGRRWCRIATLADPGFEGWAAGDFLIEGTGAAVQLPSAEPDGGGEEERVHFATGTAGGNSLARSAPARLAGISSVQVRVRTCTSGLHREVRRFRTRSSIPTGRSCWIG